MWLRIFCEEVDTILYKSNRHSCSRGGCKKNKYKSCKARFPHEVRVKTEVSSTDGYIELSHLEEMMNLARCLYTKASCTYM